MNVFGTLQGENGVAEKLKEHLDYFSRHTPY